MADNLPDRKFSPRRRASTARTSNNNQGAEATAAPALTAIQAPPPPAAPTRKVLNSWKDIAQYVGRGVRTVQRYEQEFNLPVRRVSGRERSAVMAFSDEIDRWLNRTPMRERRYVRPTLVVLDRAVPATISSRKLILEVGRFNVLTAYTVEEAYSTAERFDVDGFVLDHIPGTQTAHEICESLKELYPAKPIFLVTIPNTHNLQLPKCADYIVPSSDPQQLLDAVLARFGTPRLE